MGTVCWTATEMELVLTLLQHSRILMIICRTVHTDNLIPNAGAARVKGFARTAAGREDTGLSRSGRETAVKHAAGQEDVRHVMEEEEFDTIKSKRRVTAT